MALLVSEGWSGQFFGACMVTMAGSWDVKRVAMIDSWDVKRVAMAGSWSSIGMQWLILGVRYG